MTHDDALAALADHPHAWRYRQLCGKDNPDAAQRDGYRELVVRLASGPAVPPRVAVDYQSAPPPARPCGRCP